MATPFNFTTIPGLTANDGQLTSTAINNISSGVPLPGGIDPGAGTLQPPIPPGQLTSAADTIATSPSAGQPGLPGIFTVGSVSNSAYNFTTAQGFTSNQSSALLNSTSLNNLSGLQGSLTGVEAGLGQIGIANIGGGTTSGSSTAAAASQTPQPNILANYPTYTYRFALMMLTAGTYNNLINNPQGFVPQNVLIASGGIYGNNTFNRNQYFGDDFYFENVELETIIGLGAETRGTNAISAKFEIIEPYGCSLLNRLMDATAAVGEPNYIQVPYLFQIDFVGYDSGGHPINPIPGTTKQLPIKLIGMKFEVTEKGTVYKFEAIPINHDAFNETIVTLPVNFELSATTVNDFFNTASATQVSDAAANAERAETSTNATANNSVSQTGTTNTNQTQSVTNSQQQASSASFPGGISGAMNEWYQILLNNKSITFADTVKFVFDPEIGSAKIVNADNTDIRHTQMSPASSVPNNTYKAAAAASSITQGKYTVNFNTNAFRVNAGTNMIDLINNIVRNSDYVTNQLTDPTTANSTTSTSSTTNNTTSPYYHWKITPQITLGSYDQIRNMYSRTITYHVTKYQMNNVRYPFAPKGQASSYSKNYQYIFTGQNTDILDLSMNFETMFYTAVTATPYKNNLVSAQPDSDTNQKTNQSLMLSPQGVPFPTSNISVSNVASAISPGHATKNNKTVMAADLMANLLSKSQADMLAVDLTIVGDPAFIKQDDILYVGQNASANTSIATDSGEVYVNLTFKSGGDYDTNTGIISKNDYQASNNVFNGLYRVINVVSTFSEGLFTQKLSMVRLANQANDYKSPGTGSTSIGAERSPTGFTLPTGANLNQLNASSLTGLGSGLISTTAPISTTVSSDFSPHQTYDFTTGTTPVATAQPNGTLGPLSFD